MFDALLPMTARLILTRAHSVRAAAPEQLAELSEARGQRAECAASVEAAIEMALRAAEGQTGLVITGSLFIAAEAEAAWAARTGAPIADILNFFSAPAVPSSSDAERRNFRQDEQDYGKILFIL
jgi:hypothetical protein